MKTSTLILGGVVIAGAAYYVGSKTPTTQARSSLDTLVDGAKSIVGILAGRGKPDPTQQQAGGTGQTWGDILTGWLPGFGDSKGAATPPGAPTRFGGGSTGTQMVGAATGARLVGDGDAAISDGNGFDRAAKVLSMPDAPYTYEDRATAGTSSYSLFQPGPVRSLFG